MNYTKTEEKLMGEMQQWDIIDCHEHLPPELTRTDAPQDVFTLLSCYNRHDLFSAGLDWDKVNSLEQFYPKPTFESLFDQKIPLEKRWKTVKPYWEAIRFGSYARVANLTAKMVYGFDGINDKTYQPLSEAIAEENTPGIYQRIFDRCRIKASMTQCASTQVDFPLVPVMPGRKLSQIRKLEQLEELANEINSPVPKNLDDYLEIINEFLDRWVKEGAIGIKFVSQFFLPPNRKEAEKAFKKLLEGKELIPDPIIFFEPLESFLTHQVIDRATELDLTIAVHAGIWGDFRQIDGKHMLQLAPAHPRTRFDLYHLGMPAVRETIVVAKNLPNVFLNLCWAHILSQVQACSGIDELLDQVPTNKVLAYGGDFNRPVEKNVGHLHMAHENLAQVFGRRIDRGLCSFGEATNILKSWFWDNPLRVYPKLDEIMKSK